MSIRTFLGKLRLKLIRIILGRELFVQLTTFHHRITELQEGIHNKITASEESVNNQTTASQESIHNKISASEESIHNKINESHEIINNRISEQSMHLQEMYNSIEEMGKTIQEKIDTANLISAQYTRMLTKHIYESRNIKEIHTRTFSKYRSLYEDRDIVIMGNGPTLRNYEPKKNCITIGVNRAVYYDKVKLDYLFVQDVLALHLFGQEIVNYDCKKFFSFWGGYPWAIPIKYKNIQNMEEYCQYHVRYIDYVGCDFYNYEGLSLPYDLCNSPLTDFGSVIFPAIQFALWTNPKRIYIVGCDCSKKKTEKETNYFTRGATEEEKQQALNINVHFYDNEVANDDFCQSEDLVEGWHKIKEFQQIYYPDIEMVSINPVFLKGLFKDEYTESYLNDHPEIPYSV